MPLGFAHWTKTFWKGVQMSLTDIKAVLADTGLSDAEREAKATEMLEEIKREATKEGAANAKDNSGSLMSMFTAQSPAAKDPVEVMREVLADARYAPEEKQLLFYMSRERFQNRRKMAYWALYVLIGTAIFLALGMFADVLWLSDDVDTCVSAIAGLPANLTDAERTLALAEIAQNGCVEYPFASVLQANSEILTWLGTFFTSIIALYFGAASFRPTS